MKRLREVVLRFGGLFNKQRKNRELDDEIESHLQFHTEENLRAGMSEEEARRQALLKLGGLDAHARHSANFTDLYRLDDLEAVSDPPRGC